MIRPCFNPNATRWWRIALCTIIAAGGVACDNGHLKEMDAKDRQNLEEGVVRINLAGHRYDIPLRYHYTAWLKYKQWPTPKKDVVKVDGYNIDVLLPELRPYSEADRRKFEERGYGDKVMIYLYERSTSRYSMAKYMARLHAQRSTTNPALPELEQKPATAEAPGLLHYSDTHKDLFIISEEGSFFTIRCDFPGEKGPPFPGCTVTTDFNSNLELSYSYGRQHLPQWRQIDTRIRELFERFAYTGRVRTQNSLILSNSSFHVGASFPSYKIFHLVVDSDIPPSERAEHRRFSRGVREHCLSPNCLAIRTSWSLRASMRSRDIRTSLYSTLRPAEAKNIG